MSLLSVGELAYVLISLVLFGVSASTLWWMLHDWRGGEAPAAQATAAESDERLSFSLIVPARHEEAVLGATLSRLSAMDHPSFEIVVVVGHDDAGTRAVAERAAAARPDFVRVVTDDGFPKNKPKSLNTGLAFCRGAYVGVFDAEDEVSPDLLRRVEELVRHSGADVVQGGVQLVDVGARWFSARNCLEYLFWFRSRMHAHSRHGVVPLGGNTVFIRRDLIERAGGWDATCLAEDCEIGIRLSAAGARTAILYDKHLATREETPPTLRSFLRQRTRWNQGFLQVLRKQEWRRYPLFRQRQLARYLLAYPLFQALSAVFLPFSIAMMIFAKPPLAMSLVAFMPLSAMAVTVAVECVALREMCRDFYLPLRLRNYANVVITAIPFQLLLASAAVRSAVRELRGVRSWEKTAHLGSHREATIPTGGAFTGLSARPLADQGGVS